MRIGILGGSFNPVHLGHLFLADIAIAGLNLDRVVMVPANISPFKLDAKEMENSADNRIDMLAAAIAADSRLTIDDCEIKRGGISYTVDTIEDIIARYKPDEKPYLIIGDDLAREFLKWKDSKKILFLAEIVIARRNNIKPIYFFPHTLLKNDVMNISSHQIREKIAAGKADGNDWRSLVPPVVRAIIEDKKLYGFSRPGFSGGEFSQSLIMQIETMARETLSVKRFLHSRNTAVLAVDLCRRFNLDPAAGYLAGIAHDLGKQLDAKYMIKLVKSDDSMEISALERDSPNLLHGKAAAVLLKERFSINNKDILEAVALHTSGNENMGQLAKVIYIADKTEVSRNIDPAMRQMLFEADLDSILFAVVKKTIIKLRSKEVDLSEETVKLLEKMKERNA